MTMLKRIAVLGIVLLLPLTASAQIPVPRGAPGPSSVSGITVQGRGIARFSVKDVQFTAFTRGNADEASVIAALRAAGVENPVVGPPGPQISNGGPTVLRGTIRDVSAAKLDALRRAGAAYVSTHPGTAIDSVTFAAPAGTCAPHEDAARNAAIADARRRAQAVASMTGLTLQGVTAVYEVGGCPDTDVAGFNGPSSPFDLGTLTSSVALTEYVTFATAPAGGSLPRRPL
jgi:Protein of unknown function (DUF541)